MFYHWGLSLRVYRMFGIARLAHILVRLSNVGYKKPTIQMTLKVVQKLSDPLPFSHLYMSHIDFSLMGNATDDSGVV